MATLVLTAVGTAVGGPVGGALGALLGGAVDRNVLFKPKGRDGPRLNELAVQTSSYGTPIAQLFGTMRVAGSVIWATDLVEHPSTSGGGKRGPGSTSYSYTASFAVQLSARPILGVRRIWADGKLLRGAAGDFKVATRYRLHLGSEEQAADPLIASAEGVARAPAHRGCAYAVFEDLALADFGNRIPSLTFEVVADEGSITIGSVIEAVSGGAVRGSDVGPRIGGYSAYGETARGVVDALIDASGAWLAEGEDRLTLRAGREGTARAVVDAGVRGAGAQGAPGVRSIASADSAPRSVAVSYYDAARDYQTGLQRAGRPGAGERATRIELPIVLDASAAKAMAAARLDRFDVERERRQVALDWRGIALTPGERVTIAGERGMWRVAGWSLEAMVLGLELIRVARVPSIGGGVSGRVASAVDLPHGPTIVHAFEIPPIDDSVLQASRLTIAAAGASAGWRSAALSVSHDRGGSWSFAGSTRGIATLGWVAVPPSAAPSTIEDRVNAIEVTLAHEGMQLGDADARALDGGANLALVGRELVQFGRAARIGPARWRLTRLWRGRRGTEAAAGTAAAGDTFVLLDPATLTSIDVPPGTLGSEVRVMASGIGDSASAPPEAVVTIDGASVLPVSPVHVVAQAGGEPALRWVRRSRAGWRWIDGVDAPLAEEAERYRIAIMRPDGEVRSIEVDGQRDPFAGGEGPASGDRIAVRQVGTHGVSSAAHARVSNRGEGG